MLTRIIKRKIKKALFELFEEFVKNAKIELRADPEKKSIVIVYKKELS